MKKNKITIIEITVANMQLKPMLSNTGLAGAIPKTTAQALAAKR